MDNKQSQDTVGSPDNQPMNQAGVPSDNQSVAPPIQQTPEPSSGFAAQPMNQSMIPPMSPQTNQPTPQPMNQPQTQMSGHNNKKSNTKTIWIVAGVVVGLSALPVIVAIILNTYANVVNNANEFAANERAEYVYNGTTKSSNFSATSFKELIPATAGFFQYLNTEGDKAKDSVKGGTIEITEGLTEALLTFDKNGQPSEGGRFGVLVQTDTARRMCAVDYATKVSLSVHYPSGGDGNTAIVNVVDQTNCVKSNELKSKTNQKNGDITITPSDVLVNLANMDDSETREVLEGVRDQLLASPQLLKTIRSSFLSSIQEEMDAAYGDTYYSN